MRGHSECELRATATRLRAVVLSARIPRTPRDPPPLGSLFDLHTAPANAHQPSIAEAAPGCTPVRCWCSRCKPPRCWGLRTLTINFKLKLGKGVIPEDCPTPRAYSQPIQGLEHSPIPFLANAVPTEHSRGHDYNLNPVRQQRSREEGLLHINDPKIKAAQACKPQEGPEGHCINPSTIRVNLGPSVIAHEVSATDASDLASSIWSLYTAYHLGRDNFERGPL